MRGEGQKWWIDAVQTGLFSFSLGGGGVVEGG